MANLQHSQSPRQIKLALSSKASWMPLYMVSLYMNVTFAKMALTSNLQDLTNAHGEDGKSSSLARRASKTNASIFGNHLKGAEDSRSNGCSFCFVRFYSCHYFLQHFFLGDAHSEIQQHGTRCQIIFLIILWR